MSDTTSLATRHLRTIHADIAPLGDAATLVTTLTGGLHRVAASPDVVHRVITALDGTRPATDVLAATAAPAGFDDVLAVLLAEGSLVDERSPAPAGRPVLVVGDEDLAATLAQLITRPGREVRLLGRAEVLNASFASSSPSEVVVVVTRRLDTSWISDLDAHLGAAGVSWTQFHLEAGRAFWGPSVVPGHTADYRDLLARRRCAVDEAEVFDAMTAVSLTHAPLPEPAGMAWLLGGFAADLDCWLRGDGSKAYSVEVEADPGTLSLIRHPVLPLPDRHLVGPLLSSAPEGTARLIDERTGIIQRTRDIRHHHDVPASLATVQTHNSSMGRVDPEWANDVITGGSVFGDPALARASAIGEAVERYCGNYMGQAEIRWATYDQLLGEGEEAVDPQTLVLYSEATYATPGCPFVPFTRDLRVKWVRGRSLTRGVPIWLPVTLVFVNWIAAEPGSHPLTNYMNFSGVAAGTTIDQAIVSGLEELVERDATMVWWMNGQPLPAVRLDEDLASLWHGAPTAAGQRGWLIHLDNEFDIPVMAGIVHHRQDGWFTIGFAARPTAREAARKAWTEALTLQEGSRDLAGPDSLIRQAVDWGFASYAGLKDWRADRRYLDDYRPDWKDCADLMCQQQIFLDPRAVDAVLPWTDTAATRDLDDLPSLPDRTLATYRSRIEARGHEICFVDLTTIDVAAAGMHAVRVIVPGLVPNAPAAFPMLGTGRVQDMAVQLGWRESPLAEADINYWPIPHA